MIQKQRGSPGDTLEGAQEHPRFRRGGLQILGAGVPTFPKDGTVSRASFDKTMELRVKDGMYQGKEGSCDDVTMWIVRSMKKH